MVNTMTRKIRRYSELIELPTFEERFEYLQLKGNVGQITFGYDRYLNQNFYRSKEWRDLRSLIITRDNGYDLAHEDYAIQGRIIIHHMNPITDSDINDRTIYMMDPEFLICVSHDTHNALHYGDKSLLKTFVERKPNDTCPWKERTNG